MKRSEHTVQELANARRALAEETTARESAERQEHMALEDMREVYDLLSAAGFDTSSRAAAACLRSLIAERDALRTRLRIRSGAR